jgi:hypothetical protein
MRDGVTEEMRLGAGRWRLLAQCPGFIHGPLLARADDAAAEAASVQLRYSLGFR